MINLQLIRQELKDECQKELKRTLSKQMVKLQQTQERISTLKRKIEEIQYDSETQHYMMMIDAAELLQKHGVAIVPDWWNDDIDYDMRPELKTFFENEVKEAEVVIAWKQMAHADHVAPLYNPIIQYDKNTAPSCNAYFKINNMNISELMVKDYIGDDDYGGVQYTEYTADKTYPQKSIQYKWEKCAILAKKDMISNIVFSEPTNEDVQDKIWCYHSKKRVKKSIYHEVRKSKWCPITIHNSDSDDSDSDQ